MTRKERKALIREQFRVVSDLISPIDHGQHCVTKDVKLDEHDIDMIIDLAKRAKRIKLTRLEVVSAISNYYLTVIQPANPYIVSFRFLSTWDYGKNILKVIATIRVNLMSIKSMAIKSLNEGLDRIARN